MSRTRLLSSLLILIVALTAASAQVATPPRSGWETAATGQQRVEPSGNMVSAIIVNSWGDNPVWADLNTNWSTYGTIPVSIDHTSLVRSDFTYQDLVNSNADVIILSDPAGGSRQYSSDEVNALAKYLKAGHSILATFLTFQAENIDNRALAPLFGLSSGLTYDYTSISNTFSQVAKACLFNNITSGHSHGYPYSQVPSGGSWAGNLGAAKAVAQSDGYVGVVSGYRKQSGTAIYISSMPEYQKIGGGEEQLLYNAITCYAPNQ